MTHRDSKSGFIAYTHAHTHEGDRGTPVTTCHLSPGEEEQDRGAGTVTLLQPLQPSRAGAREALVVGIDPGVNGGLALLTAAGDLLDVVDMPTLADGTGGKQAINAPLLAAQLRAWAPARAFCEFVAARPGEGPVGAFAFGRCRGVIEGTLGAIGIPVQMLAPAWWKRRVEIPPGADRKDEARSKAISRWPAMADRFARKRDDGRAESALIAVAGLTRGEEGK